MVLMLKFSSNFMKYTYLLAWVVMGGKRTVFWLYFTGWCLSDNKEGKWSQCWRHKGARRSTTLSKPRFSSFQLNVAFICIAKCSSTHFHPWRQGESLTMTEVSLFSLHDSSRMRLLRLSYHADHGGPAPNEQILLAPNVTATVCVFDEAINPVSMSLSSGENPTSTFFFLHLKQRTFTAPSV